MIFSLPFSYCMYIYISIQFSHSVLSDSLWLCRQQPSRLPCPSPTPRACSIKSVMPSNHLILCCPLLLLPSIFPRFRVFFNGSVLHIRWPKYWSFSFSISPSNEYSELISFRMDWLVLFASQGTLKFLLQHHSSKTSICLYISMCKIEPMSLECPALASRFFTTETSRKPLFCILGVVKSLFAYIQLLFISTVPHCSFPSLVVRSISKRCPKITIC